MPAKATKPRKPRATRPPRTPADVLRLALDAEIAAAGLPPATKEYQFARKAIGRQWRIDLSWPELKIALEIEGGVHMRGRHLRPEGFVRDMQKYNQLALWGWLLIRTTYEMIEEGVTVRLLQEAFAYRQSQSA